MAEVVSETARLRLRTWDDADLAKFARHLNTPAVMRWLGGVQDDGYYAELLERVTTCQAENGHCFWIVERKEDGALLGFCGLKRVNAPGAPNTGDVEVGWRFREDAWGKGYAKEAAVEAVDLAFERFGAPHVVAFTVIGNSASWGLMERLGLKRRPELDFEDSRYGPELNPTIVYAISREDWPAARTEALS